jgi:colanic acid biosynthesis glycosyl transferase WcaI
MVKNLFITTSIFPPELHPSGIMNSELSEELSRSGHNVKVITGFPNYPKGKLFSGWQRRLLYIEKRNGYEVIRSWHPLFSSENIGIRSLSMLTNSLSYLLGAFGGKKADIVISDGPEIIGPIISAIISKICNAKLINVRHDLLVDILITNPNVNKIIKNILIFLEKLSLKLSDHIIVLSEGFRSTLINHKGVSPDKISVVPVWLDTRDVFPMNRENPWRQSSGIGSENFVVLYAGTIGLVSGAEVVFDAAQYLTSYPDILFLMVGAGHARDQMEIKAQRLGLSNLRFLPLQPRERLSELQATADVSLVTLAPGRGRTSVPSKVLGYMAAARPVIAAVDPDCDTAELIRQSGCGQVVPPGKGKGLGEAILHYYHHPKDRQSAGGKGRKYFLENLERQVVLSKYIDVIENL